MKTINYAFFIYISLTTIYKISATSDNKPNCNLPKIIRSSKYAEKCSSVQAYDKEKLPNLEVGVEPVYLCTGIFEIADRICEVNVSIASLNETTFDTEIHELESSMKNLTQFCSTMNAVIMNPDYTNAINYLAHPTVAVINKNLSTDCKEIFCWKDRTKLTANSMCAILLWENKIIATSKVLPVPTVVAQPKPPALDSRTPEIVTHLSHGTNSSPIKSNNQSDERRIISTSNLENVAKNKAADETTENKPIISHEVSNAEDNKPVSSDDKDAPKTLSQDSPASSAGSDPRNQATGANSVTAKNRSSKLDQNTRNNDPQVGQEESPGVEDPVVQIENNLRTNDNDNGKPDGDEEIAIGNNELRNYDTADDGILETNNPLSRTGKKIHSNSADETLAPSNNGKGVISHDEAGKAPSTNQGNPVSKDHGLPYSGPSDPDQHFFAYFMAVSFICLVCYVGYHKKHKIMAIIFEGRKSRGGRARRRPNTAGYRKLDCNLEEAVTSQCNSNVTHVIY